MSVAERSGHEIVFAILKAIEKIQYNVGQSKIGSVWDRESHKYFTWLYY